MFNFYKSIQFSFILLIAATMQSYCQDDLIPCDLPSNLNIKNITLNSARISWKYNENAEGWIIKWRLQNGQYVANDITELIDTNFYELMNLMPNSKYFFRIKSVCAANESAWSNEYTVVTNLTNPSACGMKLPVKDPAGNNQVEKTYFYINNEEFANNYLGEDVFIQKVRLILNHDWTSDLDIKLTSPTGKAFYLIKSLQVNNQKGFGNPDDELCNETMIFSDDACTSLQDVKNRFVGDFFPTEAISSVYDGSSPEGIWVLEVTDKIKINAGSLEFFSIDFAPVICPIPSNVVIVPENDNDIAINWDPHILIDTITLKLEGSNDTRFYKTFNSGQFIINDLIGNTKYSISLQSKCFNNLSPFSCSKEIITLCNDPSLRESFDDNEICEDPCISDCIRSDLWFNNYSFDKKWLVNEGATITENTGPENDVYSAGKYIYIESSSGQCEKDTIAMLQSVCLKVNESVSGCDMSFYYNMYGVDIESLLLEVSDNGGMTWNTLFFIEGNQGNKWFRQDIDLQDYKNKICIFRFTGKSKKEKSYGDIGLDEIIFYSCSIPSVDDYTFYPDFDKDGYGKDTTGVFFCMPEVENYVKNNFDCNDDDKDINPDAIEVKCNFIDENCNGMVDDAEGDKQLTINLINITSETCTGKKDGSITLAVTNGIAPYNFEWSDGSIDSILTSAGAGEYTCKITDMTGCGMIAGPYFIDDLGNMEIQVAEITHTKCNGIFSGEIDINVIGGSEPYTYLWSNGQISKKITGLNAGLYTVTVTESNGCFVESEQIEVKALAAFTIGINKLIEPSCYGLNNGSLELKVSGGKSPYKYLWNNGMNDAKISGIGWGDYYCTITDSDNCSQVFGPVKVNEPEKFEVQVNSIDHVRCIGQENGIIEISARGGTAPYSFQWLSYDNDDFLSFSDDIYNLRAGFYHLMAGDLNGCNTLVDSVEIRTIDSIEVIVESLIHATCARSYEGMISLKPDKGYQNYYYFWSNNSQESSVDSLSSGLYSVTIADDLGCKFVISNIEIQNLNTPIDVNLKLLKGINCHGEKSAEIDVIAASTNPPFDFNWSAGIRNFKSESADTITNIPAGSYNVTVTDNAGCVGITGYLSIIEPPGIKITEVKIDEILCNGNNSGSIELDIDGGVKPYIINWNDSKYTGVKIVKLLAGNYWAFVEDANGCIFLTDSIILYQPDEIVVKIVTKDAGKGQSNGEAFLLIEGGVSPYEIVWDENAKFQTGPHAVNLSKGWYSATITDDNECEKTILVFINEVTVSNEEDDAREITIYPNPAKDHFIIESPDNEIRSISIFTMQGKIVDNISLYRFDKSKIIVASVPPPGIYLIRIEGEYNFVFRKIVISD